MRRGVVLAFGLVPGMLGCYFHVAQRVAPGRANRGPEKRGAASVDDVFGIALLTVRKSTLVRQELKG